MNDRPQAELIQIARDIHHGKIFCNLHIRQGDTADLVFLPLAFLDEENRKKLLADPPGLVFEYLDKASERSMNGYPGFFSMQLLSIPDAIKVVDMLQALAKAEAEVLRQ